MLVLSESRDVFDDHADSSIRYRLPSGLKPLFHGSGLPQVLVSRSEAGGVLQLRLIADWPAFAPGDRAAPLASSRFRLVMRTPGGPADIGAWRESAVSDVVLVDRSVSLSPVEAAIVRRLGTAGSELVDVEVEATVRGFSPTYPWTAYAPGDALLRTLKAALGAGPVPWATVENVFLGLGPETFTWRAAEAAALPPPDSAKSTLARHAAPFLLELGEGGWTARASAPEQLALNLAAPVVDSRTIGFRWSFTDFLAAQPDRSKHLIDVSVPAPFEAAEIVIANDVPLADQGISRLEVEVQTGGPTGRVRHAFVPGEPSAARLPFVRATFNDLALRWKAKITVTTAGGPAVVESGSMPTGLSIQIRTEDLGVTPVKLQAEAELLRHVESLECVVGARRVALTAAEPEAWLVGRTPPLSAEVIAKPASGASVSLGPFPLAGGLFVPASTLGIGEVIPITLSASDALWAEVAYLGVQVEGGPWRTLERGASLSWPVRREHRFHIPRLRYRTRRVPKASDGATQPMQESGWRDGQGESILVEV